MTQVWQESVYYCGRQWAQVGVQCPWVQSVSNFYIRLANFKHTQVVIMHHFNLIRTGNRMYYASHCHDSLPKFGRPPPTHSWILYTHRTLVSLLLYTAYIHTHTYTHTYSDTVCVIHRREASESKRAPSVYQDHGISQAFSGDSQSNSAIYYFQNNHTLFIVKCAGGRLLTE